MDNELALRLFVSVVERNSFSKGGAYLGVPQATTSRMISKLEQRLGGRLLQRSTRKLTLTEAGQIYFERASRIVVELDEAADAVRNASAAPSGLLRIAAPVTFGRLFIAPLLLEFYKRYPDINIGLSLSDGIEDVIGQGYDIAIRLGELKDSGLIAHRLAESSSVVCASPDYLKANAIPTTTKELSKHNCLQFRTSPGQNTWRFTKAGIEHNVEVQGSFYANSGDAIIAAALAGLGVCYLPVWMLHTHIEQGNLQKILIDFEPKTKSTPIQAVVAYRNYVPAKQRIFIDYLQQQLATLL